MTEVISKNSLLVTSDKTVINRDFFNKRFGAIADGMNASGTRLDSFDASVANLVSVGLQRINDVLGPFLIKLQAAAQLGFLVCKADGVSLSLTEEAAVGFVVTDGKELFTPTPYLLAMDDTDSTNWGIVSVDEGGWTSSTGDLATHCVYAATPGVASTQWTISCNAAITAVMNSTLDAAIAAQNAAEAALATVVEDMGNLNDLIAAVQSGPVVSVAGKTGAIDLALADIAGLVDALAAKVSTTAMNSAIATRQPSSALLTALVNLTLASDKLVYATGASTLATSTLTTFMRSVLDDIDAATARTTLGVDTAIQTAIDALQSDESIAAAIAALNLDTASQHPATDFATPASVTSAISAAIAAANLQPAGNYMKYDATATVSKGFTITPNNAGTKSGGVTFTPDPTLGNYQFATNGGAHTLAAPSVDCAIDILYTNNASAGTITPSGFTPTAFGGDALTTTNGHKFIITILRINGTATAQVKALQ